MDLCGCKNVETVNANKAKSIYLRECENLRYCNAENVRKAIFEDCDFQGRGLHQFIYNLRVQKLDCFFCDGVDVTGAIKTLDKAQSNNKFVQDLMKELFNEYVKNIQKLTNCSADTKKPRLPNGVVMEVLKYGRIPLCTSMLSPQLQEQFKNLDTKIREERAERITRYIKMEQQKPRQILKK